MPKLSADLIKLAQLYGIQTKYVDNNKKIHYAAADVLLFILNQLSIPINSVEQAENLINDYYFNKAKKGINTVNTFWLNGKKHLSLFLPQKAIENKLFCTIESEFESNKKWTVLPKELIQEKLDKLLEKDFIKILLPLPELKPGYYSLTINTKNIQFTSILIVAPEKAYVPSNLPSWGLFAPVYSLKSKKDFGCGDLGTLKQIAHWCKAQGGSFIGSLPLNAIFIEKQSQFSPYSPISKLFWNELYLDINQLSDFFGNPILNDELTNLSNLKKTQWVEYPKVYTIKRKIIKNIVNQQSLNRLLETGLENWILANSEARDYAHFQALYEKNLYITESYESLFQYHLFVQWQMEKQLGALRNNLNNKNFDLYFDVPLGTHKKGFDVQQFGDLFCKKLSVGNPPDSVFTKGQNWSFPPLNPLANQINHYQYLRRIIQKAMLFSNFLRIDHVMSLHRLFVIPEGAEASEGVYLRYPAEDYYGIWCLESVRNKVCLIGENLGAVPDEVQLAMKKHSLLKMYVAQYEWDINHKVKYQAIPKQAMVSINTHDMPTFAAYMQGLDLEIRRNMQLLNSEKVKKTYEERKIIISRNYRDFLKISTPKKLSLEDSLSLLLNYLSACKNNFFLINIEDIWLETNPQNIPTSDYYPNWQKKLKFSLEEIMINDQIKNLLLSVSQQQEKQKKKDDNSFSLVKHYSLFSTDDLYLFNEGTHSRLYKKMGAHVLEVNGEKGTYFAVWAPNAKQISVIGDFNQWNCNIHLLQTHGVSGIWEGFIPNLESGQLYKYAIESHQYSGLLEKNDPFAFYNEIPPNTASIIWDIAYTWEDEKWMSSRQDRQRYDKPIAIYEVHLGSWRRKVEANNGYLTYREIAPLLANYIKEMGFTHVELLPVMEHPFYGSWGYQTTNYFAPTARYGTPQDFMYFIDYLHQNEIGVILDWVPSHFPSDEYALHFFDGTHLFEHSDPNQRTHPDWKSDIFNYDRHEVRSFLISSALFWLDKFHIDGLRVDAVASMLYLDYSRKAGEWIPNQYGGNENLGAINFLKRLNEVIYSNYPDVITIAEESTAWTGVSKPTYLNGLGFGYKWDMGWMHDTLRYLARDSVYRRYHHNELSFRMIYAYNENFILPLSHDEVVHGKGSLLRKMPGNDWEKFANLRLLFAYLYTIPGKKHLFMGMEFASWDEWNHEKSLDWHLLNYEPHQKIQSLICQLNAIYMHNPALYELETCPEGFEWIDASDESQSVYSYLRKGRAPHECLLIVINATPIVREDYCIGVPLPGCWQLLLNTDASMYGGSGEPVTEHHYTFNANYHGRPNALSLHLRPLSVLILKFLQS